MAALLTPNWELRICAAEQGDKNLGSGNTDQKLNCQDKPQVSKKPPKHVVVEIATGRSSECGARSAGVPPPHGGDWQQSQGHEARPQSLLVVWNFLVFC